MKIYMIRHALSTSNGSHTWTGQTDVPLSEAGIAAQKELLKKYNYPEGDIYFSSPLLRCTQTLDIIYGHGADILMPEFMECSLGILEGRPYTNLNDDPNYLAWIGEPDKPIPNGESFNTFRERAELGFIKMVSAIADRNAKTAVAVMHGNVMRAILHRFADASVPHDEWKIPNGGVYRLDISDETREVTAWSSAPGFLFDR
ncbi:MAG: histidine phosphatase family protein [Synergistaceae bacterium]|nr:histidine phosphatase family protein [Synergistaceae bacterium]